MSHSINGIIANIGLLLSFTASHALSAPTPLSAADLAFLPLSEERLDKLFPVCEGSHPAFVYFHDGLRDCLIELSQNHPVAYIETDYFGGEGTQAAVVYQHGVCVMEPENASIGPINSALKLLGVVKLNRYTWDDEFATAGLMGFRSNEALPPRDE